MTDRVIERNEEGSRRFGSNRRGVFHANHPLHHPVSGAAGVQRTDVGMIERGDGAHFAIESIAEALRGHFDRDVTTEPGIKRLVDLTHAARSQEAVNLVRPEL